MLFVRVLVCSNLKQIFTLGLESDISVYTARVGLTSKTTGADCNEMLFTLGIRWMFIVGKGI
jgi:hypothetical protein